MRDDVSGEVMMPTLRTCDEVKTYSDDVRGIWNGSKACLRFKSIIKTALPYCDNNVAFALGELSRPIREGSQLRSAFQHALLLTLRTALEAYHAEENITCYAQDPAYSTTDRALLDANGITVVDDPEGLLQVNNSSAVLSCGPNVPIKEIIADIARPALIIWVKVDIYTQRTGR